jgi:hypothetical protein
MLPRARKNLILALAFIILLPGAAVAQTSTVYSLADVMDYLRAGLDKKILDVARNSCISFKVTQSVSDRLRAEGASDAIISGLRSACYKSDVKSDSKSGGDARDQVRTRDTQRTNPSKPTTVIKDRTRTNVTPVTPTITPTVYSPPLTSTANNSVVDWNFRTSRPLTPGKYNNCQYDYTSSGYSVTVLEYGSSCLDGSMQEWESNLRVSTQATPVSGAPGYTYGLRFGISDDTTIGYYAFEVSSYGHFELSRYRNNKWEVVFPWQTGTGINANSTNTITADIRGSTVTFTINGISQYTYQAPATIRGRAGFGIIGFDKTGPFPSVVFSSFTVSGEKGTAPIPVVTPVTNVTPNSVDYDFRTSQPLTSGRYGKCQYDYSSSGYTVSVAEAGTTCIDGPLGEQPANVRIATTAVGLRGETGYTYGLRFGYTSDSTIGYYAFELSEGGSFQLSRYRMKQWEPLIPWQRISAVNPASSAIPNNMSVEVRGTSLTLYVNGSQVGTYQTPYPVVGPAGFGIIGYEQSGVMPAVTFSRFSITPLSSSPVVTPVTPVVTPSSTSVSWNFASEQPLSTGLYSKCRYDYSNGGYTVSVDQPGSTCIDGPTGDRPASIRVSTTARGLRGGTGYTYGLRLGYTTDQSIGYYAFELSEGGSFQLSRYRNNAWEPLIPWQRISAVNPASTGIPNDMTAEIRGTSIVLYVNGVQVGSYQAPYPIVGPAGFGIIGYDQSLANPAVVFTRFSITPLY